jgi:hypothetical protein
MQNLLQYDEVNWNINTEIKHEIKQYTYGMDHMWIPCEHLIIYLKTTAVMSY